MGVKPRGPAASPSAIAAFVTARLRAVADPAKAPAMAAYMKTDMPFHGVQKPDRVPIIRDLRGFALPDRAAYEAAVRALWRLRHREDKYLALALARQRREHVTAASLPLYEQLIREGAWWDFVDEVAVQLVGAALRADPAAVWPIIDRWIDDDDMWIRRTALICQIKHGADTDAARLFRYCARRAHEREFFIRKAIGWALREYARTAPDAVAAFVRDHRAQLSGLSYREATKHLPGAD